MALLFRRAETVGAIVIGHYEEQFCGIIFNLDQLFKRSCLLKILIFWSSCSPFV